MKRIEVAVLPSHLALDAFAEAWHTVQKAGEPVIAKLTFGTTHELFAAITAQRLDLLRCLAANEGLTCNELANILGDYKTVQRDVAALTDLGLIAQDGRGRLSAPFDEIVIRAGLRAAA